MIDLSVIVTSWNTRALTLACVEAVETLLAATALRWELLVVDNGSGDGSAAALRRHAEVGIAKGGSQRLRLFALPQNLGFARANNRAIAEARGRTLLFLNSDARLGPGAVEACLEVLEADPKIGIAGPQLLHVDGSMQNSVHAFPSLWTELFPIALLEWALPRRYPSKRAALREPTDVEAVQGAALFARRALIDAIGPFPEDYFFFLEETAWCWQARAAGWRVVFVPDARVVHDAGSSSKRPYPGPTAIEYHRSLYRFLSEYRSPVTRWLSVGLRAVRAALAVPLLLLRAPWSERARRRLRSRAAVLLWHLRGCPAGGGLEGMGLDGSGQTRNPARVSGTG